MAYSELETLSEGEFKRLCGVSRKTFGLMVDIVKADAQKKKKPGRRPKLIIEDQVLMVLQYWSGANTVRLSSKRY